MGGSSKYIKFLDPAMEALCIAKFSSDGIGVTPADAAAVTTFNGVFSGDTSATSFREMVYFTGLGTGQDPEYCTNGLFFSGLKSVTEVTLPRTLRYLSASTFRNSLFTFIDVPASVEYINSLCFTNASRLETIVMRPTTPPSLVSGAFQENASGLKIYVPYSEDHSVLAAYQSASNWSSHASKMLELNPDGTIPTN